MSLMVYNYSLEDAREDVMRHTGIHSTIATILSLLLLCACSRETADWKSASTADTIEAYQQFLQQHPKAAETAAAQARLKTLTDDRAWQAAAGADTRAAYEQFVAQHADSKWVQEARIRIENFAQGAGAASTAAAQPPASPAVPPGGTPAKLAKAAAPGNFVQLGAFSSKQRAQSEWKLLAARFPSELKSLKPAYVRGKSKNGTVYRLRVPVASVDAAKGLCGALKKHQQLCVPGTA
jgi:cell division septation protein DedD